MNRVLLTGRLTRDPEMRALASGKHVTSFSVATNEYVGNGREKAEYHAVIAWDRLADICAQYLGKGSMVAVEGRLQTRQWDDEAGKRHWKTEVVAASVEMLSGRTQEGLRGRRAGGPGDRRRDGRRLRRRRSPTPRCRGSRGRRARRRSRRRAGASPPAGAVLPGARRLRPRGMPVARSATPASNRRGRDAIADPGRLTRRAPRQPPRTRPCGDRRLHRSWPGT